jgi:hypothetical protein
MLTFDRVQRGWGASSTSTAPRRARSRRGEQRADLKTLRFPDLLARELIPALACLQISCQRVNLNYTRDYYVGGGPGRPPF